VEEEKMTHGHADENSIVLLMKDGSVLLHDGGYRDYMPSGSFGAYRQDYFHNRVCVRPEKIFFGQKAGEYRYSIAGREPVPEQGVLEFLRNAGSYREVRTQKIDFLTFPDMDYSRTRLLDEEWGYQWDRILVYIKEPGLFVVMDVIKALKEGYLTASNLWHTRRIVEQGVHWYDTAYDSLRNLALKGDTRLLILFPQTHYRFERVEPENRYYQNEWVISQTVAQHFERTQTVCLTTLLIPHRDDVDPDSWTGQVQMIPADPVPAGLAVRIRAGDTVYTVGIKKDLRNEMIRDWRRPKYTYESGKIRFGALETNADFIFFAQKGVMLDYTAVNMTRLVHGGRTLFDQPLSYYGLAFDGSPDAPGVGKVRYWRDRVRIPGADE
jgi:hypothetical protein